jgi:hypothetical protein
MQIFGDILPVPGISAESKNHNPLIPAIFRRQMNAMQALAIRRFHDQWPRSRRQRPGTGNRVDREDQIGLRLDHQQEECRKSDESRKQKDEQSPSGRSD